jgi:sugar lactone lactonase YvrE
MNATPPLHFIPLPGHGPEDVVIDRHGRLLVGLADGRLLAVDAATGTVSELANTGGRPLGLEALDDGRVLVCDSPRGLLELKPDAVTALALVTELGGRPMPFCSNVVAGRDGTQYFSVSSMRHSVAHYKRDLAEKRPSGALYARAPDGKLRCLLDGIFFANGLALDHDEQWIIVAETGGLCLRRLWLAGPRAGEHELFANLPGFPDNLSMSRTGLIWVAIAAAANTALAAVHTLPFPLRWLVARLPEALQPKAPPVAWVQAFDSAGQLVHDFRWDDGSYSFVTGVCEHEGKVYLGSLIEPAIAWFALP